MKTKSETAFNGVVILTLALIIVKILSAIYRIPYQNVLGDDGLYAYQQIYPVVALGVILSMNAIPSAVTQVIGVNRSDEVYTRVMFRLQCIGFIVFILLFMFANMITRWMGDSNLAPMLKMASFSFILIGVLGVLRGFYQSKQVMTIPAISQVIEQVIRVSLIIVAIIMFSMKHWSIYQAGALAILASSIGFLGSMLYLLLKKPLKLKLCYRFNNTSIQWKQLFISISIFALSQLIVILWQVVDSFTIIRLLQHSGIAFKEAIIQKGIYDRGASFIQMGLIVTTTFSFVLIPLLTQAIREHNQIHMNRYANASIKITVVISTAASIGLINLLPLMNVVFFKSNHLTLTLSVYMFTVICVSLIMMNISLLQVQTSIRPIIMGVIIGILSKIILNVILIPFWGIVGASVSTVLSLLLFVIILQVAVLKYYRFNRISLFIVKLILGMIIMSIVVQTVMLALPSKSRMLGLLELIVSSITIVGLGNYGIDELPLGIYRFLEKESKVYARTLNHPVINTLKKEIEFESFDSIYEAHDRFEDVYEAIVTSLIELAQSEDIVYAVPGHPRVAETTTVKLLEYSHFNKDISVKVLGGKSFIDDIFEAVDVDPNDGFTLLDGTSLKESALNVRTNTVITQVYSVMIAADLKLTLMERYPDDFNVKIITGSHSDGAHVIECPLYEIDRYDDYFNNLTSLFIPKINEDTLLYQDFDYAVQTIDLLVDNEKGCPWDKVQTHDSLKRYLLEETFELFEAIDNEDDWHMIEELGDILLQVLLHSSIGKKEGYIDIKEIIESLNTKMIHRHPHIFGNAHVTSQEDLKDIWSRAKEKEGKVPRVKFEKVFADHFLKLYDKTKNRQFDEDDLKQFLQQGEKNS